MMAMEIHNENPNSNYNTNNSLIELETNNSFSIEGFQKAMESQKQLFHSQIDQLRDIVVSQCKLTGVNPLSQEMAAGALSIKIGKRPRDLMNPKAVKYMQLVFSIKDAISKKELREIGALFGITGTQVKEYFANQKSRVRKMVRLSRERAIRAGIDKEFGNGVSLDSEPVPPADPVPLSSIGPSSAEEAPSCSNQDEVLPGLNESEKHFVQNIFTSMCKEDSFAGQVKVMQWILQMENPSVLCWFLTKGGVMILATWLSQAVTEEQTSVLSVTLEVLFHLPLHKALPAHMSVILQAVNRLRFYRISDVSNRARALLSKWSKMFAKSQALKKPNGVNSAGSQDIDLRQRIGELIGDDLWQSSVDNSDGVLVPSFASPDNTRQLEAVKLLTSSEDSNKKLIVGTSHNKERRRVLLVEHTGQKMAVKSSPVKAAAANQARPITADEIQKAKRRAQFMQSNKKKSEDTKKHSLLTNDLLSASEAYLRPKIEAQKLEAQKNWRLPPPKIPDVVDPPSDLKPILYNLKPILSNLKPILSDLKPVLDPIESLLDKCRRVQIPWLAPPEVQMNEAWELGTGQNSKEIEAQRNRMLREKETIYPTIHEVPPDPKDPWDIEIDYDDTLTPEIPTEQLPESEVPDASVPAVSEIQNPQIAIPNPAPTSISQAAGAEPDLELLAVLLKNPELVFALTSGQASGLSSEDTVRLLDMLKSSGGAALLNAKPEEKVAEVSLPSPTPSRNVEVSLPSPTPPSRFEVSLPSPTPSCDPGPSGWQTQTAKNPFSRNTTPPLTGVATSVAVSDRLQNHANSLQSQFPSASTVSQFSHQTSIPQQTSYFISDSVQTFNHPSTQIPSVNHHLPQQDIEGLQMHPQHHLSEPYSVHDDNTNRAMVNGRHGYALQQNPSYSYANHNAYNPSITNQRGPASMPGPSWGERNDIYTESSPARYSPPEHLLQGQGWNYQDQRGYNGTPDRFSRQHNSPGYQEYNRRGGGGGGYRRR